MVQSDNVVRRTGSRLPFLQDPSLLQKMRWETANRYPRPDRMLVPQGGTLGNKFLREEFTANKDTGFAALPLGLDHPFQHGWDNINPPNQPPPPALPLSGPSADLSSSPRAVTSSKETVVPADSAAVVPAGEHETNTYMGEASRPDNVAPLPPPIKTPSPSAPFDTGLNYTKASDQSRTSIIST